MGEPSVPDALADELADLGRQAGLDAVGIADASPFHDTRRHLEERSARGLAADMQFTYRNPARSTDPGRILAGARSLVVGARHTPAPRLGPPAAGRARIAAYARTDHYATLRTALGRIAERLGDAGWQARVVADDNALVDREAAVRAGLGWYGKNANVLLPGRGSWFVLGSVVTDAPLPPTNTPVRDGCGNCERCLDACPTGAIVEPGVVDARRCIAWLVQAPGSIPTGFRRAVGDRLYGCDDCQEACPIGQAGRPGGGPDEAPLEDQVGGSDEGWGADIEARWVLAASDDDLLDRFGHWYLAERDPRYLRRNALVVLGNTARGDDEAAAAALRHHLGHPDPMLREHAGWALGELAARSPAPSGARPAAAAEAARPGGATGGMRQVGPGP